MGHIDKLGASFDKIAKGNIAAAAETLPPRARCPERDDALELGRDRAEPGRDRAEPGRLAPLEVGRSVPPKLPLPDKLPRRARVDPIAPEDELRGMFGGAWLLAGAKLSTSASPEVSAQKATQSVVEA